MFFFAFQLFEVIVIMKNKISTDNKWIELESKKLEKILERVHSENIALKKLLIELKKQNANNNNLHQKIS